MGPPNVLQEPKPTSSSITSKIFGAPFTSFFKLSGLGSESAYKRDALPAKGFDGLGISLIVFFFSLISASQTIGNFPACSISR
jgi:hypothetical protein